MGLEGRNTSLWVDSAPRTSYPALTPGLHVDVAVLGGGIAGLTTALLLKRNGARVAVIEAGRGGNRGRGGATAEGSAPQSAVFSPIPRRKGGDAAGGFAAARPAAPEARREARRAG